MASENKRVRLDMSESNGSNENDTSNPYNTTNTASDGATQQVNITMNVDGGHIQLRTEPANVTVNGSIRTNTRRRIEFLSLQIRFGDTIHNEEEIRFENNVAVCRNLKSTEVDATNVDLEQVD